MRKSPGAPSVCVAHSTFPDCSPLIQTWIQRMALDPVFFSATQNCVAVIISPRTPNSFIWGNLCNSHCIVLAGLERRDAPVSMSWVLVLKAMAGSREVGVRSRHGSAVKMTAALSEGLVQFQHPHDSLQWSVMLVQEIWHPGRVCVDTRHACGTHTEREALIHAK